MDSHGLDQSPFGVFSPAAKIVTKPTPDYAGSWVTPGPTDYLASWTDATDYTGTIPNPTTTDYAGTTTT